MPFRLLYFYLLVKIWLKYQNLWKLALFKACKASDTLKFVSFWYKMSKKLNQ